MDNALELTGVCKKFGDFSLNNVGFCLPSGSIMGFVGENGAGKTSTIKTILNIVRPDAGAIRMLGEDALAPDGSARKKVGYVPDTCCFHAMLNLKNVNGILKGIFSDWDEELFYQYARQFSLPEKKAVKDYSKGMKMKLNIAAAMAHHPQILLMDEATSGLDPMMREEILDLLLEFIQDEGHSVLLSSHITSDLEKVADYITFIHRGEIVFTEPKDRLCEKYALLRCGRGELANFDQSLLAGIRESAFGAEALVLDRERFLRRYPGAMLEIPTIEEIMVHFGKERFA